MASKAVVAADTIIMTAKDRRSPNEGRNQEVQKDPQNIPIPGAVQTKKCCIFSSSVLCAIPSLEMHSQ